MSGRLMNFQSFFCVYDSATVIACVTEVARKVFGLNVVSGVTPPTVPIFTTYSTHEAVRFRDPLNILIQIPWLCDRP